MPALLNFPEKLCLFLHQFLLRKPSIICLTYKLLCSSITLPTFHLTDLQEQGWWLWQSFTHVKITNYLLVIWFLVESRRAWETILLKALQESKSTLSALGNSIDEGSWAPSPSVSRKLGNLQIFLMVAIAMTSDVARGQACLISCCLFKAHPRESIFIAGTSVYRNPDVLGKCVRNFGRARHWTKFAGIINRDV